MTWRLGTTILVALMVGLFAASSAQAMTRALQPAMQRYSLCRAAPGSRVGGGITSIYKGRLTVETLMTNKAALVVDAGRGPHRVFWITSHGIVEHLFTFRHLYNVPRRLGEACR